MQRKKTGRPRVLENGRDVCVYLSEEMIEKVRTEIQKRKNTCFNEMFRLILGEGLKVVQRPSYIEGEVTLSESSSHSVTKQWEPQPSTRGESPLKSKA